MPVRSSIFFALKVFLKLIPLVLLIGLSTSVNAASRHALVIGNSEYGAGFRLVNPRNDSTAIAQKLSGLGYRVHGGAALLDLKIDEFNREIDNFLAAVQPGSSTLIYYAGHGAASGGSNYLVPILPDNVTLRSETDLRNQSLSLDGILERVNRRNPTGVNVFFFDACRDGPVDNFTRSINLTGLTRIDTARQPRGSFVGFSTEYGKSALDGSHDGHSPFASAFLKALDETPSAPIELFYKKVVGTVYERTEGLQVPIQESKLIGSHCIIPCLDTYRSDAIPEFGTLIVNTKPLNATVCFRIEGWRTKNCGQQMVLPLQKDVTVTVAAKGYKPYTTVTRLAIQRQQLSVQLDKKNNTTMKVLGGLAAIVVTGILLSGDSDPSPGTQGETSPVTVTLVPPGQ